jgi:hypothetical protein
MQSNLFCSHIILFALSIFDGETSVFKLTRKAATHAGIEGAVIPEILEDDGERHSGSIEKGSIGKGGEIDVVHRENAGKNED